MMTQVKVDYSRRNLSPFARRCVRVRVVGTELFFGGAQFVQEFTQNLTRCDARLIAVLCGNLSFCVLLNYQRNYR